MYNRPVNILISGATGFVGAELGKTLSQHGNYLLKALVRRSDISIPWAEETFQFHGLSSTECSEKLFNRVDVAIHCAARVHVMDDKSADPLTEFRKVNVEGTINLAKLAAKSGVKRFIFLSSIKVNGESTDSGRIYKADDIPAPQDAYGISKTEAEEALKRVAMETSMEVVIIRPVLVYGPGVKANFLNMVRWLHKGIPLPLGAINNKRSLVALDNLIDLIKTCIEHPAAANEIFIAADGEDLSTTDLLRRMGIALNVPNRLIPIPQSLLIFAATALRKQAFAQRLCCSLQVDISKARDLLDWKPPLSVDEGLQQVANYYRMRVTKQ